jgi:hypothetical protein
MASDEAAICEGAKRMEKKDLSRREFVRKAAYIAPAIATFAVAPSYAKPGSVKPIPIPRPRPSPVALDAAIDTTAITQ